MLQQLSSFFELHRKLQGAGAVLPLRLRRAGEPRRHGAGRHLARFTSWRPARSSAEEWDCKREFVLPGLAAAACRKLERALITRAKGCCPRANSGLLTRVAVAAERRRSSVHNVPEVAPQLTWRAREGGLADGTAPAVAVPRREGLARLAQRRPTQSVHLPVDDLARVEHAIARFHTAPHDSARGRRGGRQHWGTAAFKVGQEARARQALVRWAYEDVRAAACIWLRHNIRRHD